MDWIERKIAPNRKVALWRRRLAHKYRFWKRPDYPVSDIRQLVANFFPGLVIDENSVVLDFGANEGHFSLLYGGFGAKVLAFEPNPWVFRNASARLRSFPNVTLVSAAVGATSSVVELYFPEEYGRAPELHSGSASVVASNHAVETGQSIPVFQVSIREILQPFEKVDFLKIDIEGAEAELWPAIEESWEKIDYLAIETHENLLEGKGGDTQWLERAHDFIAKKNLGDRWRLDWP